VSVVIGERFARAYAKLPGDVQKKVDKALRLLDEDFRHPSLRARRMEGAEGIYEARVDRRHRMTYHRDGDRLVMRNVGEHDKTLEHP
jgi:mRNA-degrading endonuclease RelE of RelBE toxin-antitoxin system